MSNLLQGNDAVWVTKHQAHDGACWGEVILNRPERKNAIVGPLGLGLAEGIALLDADSDVQAIVLRGAGGSFCSGLDLAAFNDTPEPEWLPDFQRIWRSAHRALFECSTPLIGAMERYAINGGAALAIACDYLVVGEKSFLQVGEVQIGMAAPYNMAWLNLRHSEAVIAQVTLVGDRIAGPELLRLGLATQCVDDAQVIACATDLAKRMATFPSGTTSKIKRGIRARLGETGDQWFDRHTQVAGPSVKPSTMKSR
jgi:enoyl-CoA hydratase/carnithine racemase